MMNKPSFFKFLLLIFFLFMIYISVTLIYKSKFKKTLAGKAISTLTLPRNQEFNYQFNMPDDGILWLRLRPVHETNIDNISNYKEISKNCDILYPWEKASSSAININSKENLNRIQQEVKNANNYNTAIDKKRSACRKKMAYGNISTSLISNLDGKVIEKKEFIEMDYLRKKDIPIAGFFNLQKGQSFTIQISTRTNKYSNSVRENKYKLILDIITK